MASMTFSASMCRGSGSCTMKAIDGGIFVEALHNGQQIGLRNVVLKAQQGAGEAHALAGQHLVAHVGFGATVVAHQHGGQVRRPVAGGGDFGYFGGNFNFDVFGGLLAVDEVRGGFGHE